MKIILKKIYAWFPDPQFRIFRNLKLFNWLNQNACGKKVLNLGSGIGDFDKFISKDIKTINFDIDFSKPNLNIVGDAHYLPFKNDSLDIVYTISVLEHVRKPWVVSDEIYRVLKPGGHVVLDVPFLSAIHDKNDYFRFTDKGIRSLFDEDKFEPVFEQVGSAGGSFLSVFLYVYLKQFIPTRILKIMWEISARYFFYLFKYLDMFIDKSQSMRITANSFSYIGRKL